MQRQFGLFCRSFVTGAIAFSVFVPSAFAAPSFEHQQSFSAPIIVARGFPGGNTAAMTELDLTTTQQAEIQAIQADMFSQMSQILTAEQMQTLKDSQASGDTSDVRRIMMGLNRGDRSSVMNIMRSAQSAVMDVLTDEQREQLENNR